MKSRGTALAACALAISAVSPVFAQQEPPQEEHLLTYNVAVTSDYRFRGISQTRLNPALQGGADYTHNPTGLYAGTWLSNINWTKDAGGSGNIEWDLYGGKRGEIAKGVTYDVGGLYYFYPSNGLRPNANTFELYGQLGFGPAYIKYSNSLTNAFATLNSKHSAYLDIGANIDLAKLYKGLTLNLHAGRQDYRHNDAFSYTDYKAGLTQDLGVCTVQLAYVKANTNAYLSPSGKNLGRSAAQLTALKTF